MPFFHFLKLSLFLITHIINIETDVRSLLKNKKISSKKLFFMEVPLMANYLNNVSRNQQEVKSVFQMNVERQIRNSSILPTMCFREAKKYLIETLVERLGTCKNQEKNEEMQMQLLELCMFFGVDADDYVRKVQNVRLSNSRLNCELDELPTYVRMLQEQVQDMEKSGINDQLAQQANKIIKAQLREAYYVLNV